ncbi:hypothetical protein OnM2_064063 [Erysiphe neolycopersici]|uniref:Uncharacterized protein n=1 Tax=Erysiphe neolycopersici TaxID=212602 RepID=A0A420HNP5_9PEZI|nr:hypothetical protein OnM2_064063 [Erysiphe neolycopersici]
MSCSYEPQRLKLAQAKCSTISKVVLRLQAMKSELDNLVINISTLRLPQLNDSYESIQASTSFARV